MGEVDDADKLTHSQTCLNEDSNLMWDFFYCKGDLHKISGYVDVAVSDKPTISKQIYLSVDFCGTPLWE